MVREIARNMAEGGFSDLARLTLEIVKSKVTEDQWIRVIGNEFVQINPSEWEVNLDVEPNVGLGQVR